MPISFLKSTANNNGYVVRPSGYTFPVGLNQTQVASFGASSIDYLVVAGGGGAGNTGTSPGIGTNGTANRGGGGGGGGRDQGGGESAGGAGGSGIVIIRYVSTYTGGATGGTITSPSGYTVHTFTGPGSFTSNSNFGIVDTYFIN